MNSIVNVCIQALDDGRIDERKRLHAATTLSVLSRSLLSKNFAGWEVMEVFAGGVSGSDAVFKVSLLLFSIPTYPIYDTVHL